MRCQCKGAILLAACSLLEAQSFQTQFSPLAYDRSRSPRIFQDVVSIEISTGGQEVEVPLGPGIGSREMHYTPTLRGHFRPMGGVKLHASQAMSEFDCTPGYPPPSSLTFPYRRLVHWQEYAYADFVKGFDLSPGVLTLPLAGPVAPFYDRKIFWYTDENGSWPYVEDRPAGRCSHYQVQDAFRRAIRQIFRHYGYQEAGLVSCTTPTGESLIESRLASTVAPRSGIPAILEVFGFPSPWALAEPDGTPDVQYWNLRPATTTDGALILPLVHPSLAPLVQVDSYNGCTPQDEESRPGSGAANDAAFPQYRLPSAYLIVKGDLAFLYKYSKTDYGLDPTYVIKAQELEGRNARFAEYRVTSMRNRSRGQERVDWDGLEAKYFFAGQCTGASVKVEPGKVVYATGDASAAPSYSLIARGGAYGGDFWQCPDTGSSGVMSPFEKHYWMFKADGTENPMGVEARDSLQSLQVDSVKDDHSGQWIRFNAAESGLPSGATVSFTPDHGTASPTSVQLQGVITSVEFGSDGGGVDRQIRFGFEKYPFLDDSPRALGSKPFHDVCMNTDSPNTRYLPKYFLGVVRMEDQDLLASGPAATRVTTFERRVPEPGLSVADPFAFTSTTFDVKVTHPDGSRVIHTYAEPNGSPKSLQYLCYLKHLETRRERYSPSGTRFEVEVRDRPSLASPMNLAQVIGSQTTVPHFTRTRIWRGPERTLHTIQAASFDPDPGVAGYTARWEAWSEAGKAPDDLDLEQGPSSPSGSRQALDAHPQPEGLRITRTEIRPETLPEVWILDRPARTTQVLVKEATGNLETGKGGRLPAIMHKRALTFDAANPELNRRTSERLSRGSGGILLTFAYASPTGPLALRPSQVTVTSDLPEVTRRPGTTGAAYEYHPTLGHLARVQPLGAKWAPQETRDPLGRVTAQADANQMITDFGWDASGRLLSSAPSGEVATTFAADPDGRGAVVKRGGQKTAFRTNAFGQVVLERRYAASGASHRAFGYDPAGRCTWTTPWLDGEGSDDAWSHSEPPTRAAWRQAFDGLGRIVRRTDPTGVATTFAYAPASGGGSVQTRTTASGTTTLSWGVDGCLASAVDALGLVTRYTYDLSGRLNKVIQRDPRTGVTQSRAWSRNDVGWVTGADQPETGPVTFSDFDALGNAWTLDGNGRKRLRVFDTLGRLKREFAADASLDNRYFHDADVSGHGLGNDRLIRTQSIQGIQRDWYYLQDTGTNPAGRLSRLDTSVDGATYSQVIGYDAYGQKVARQYPDGSIQAVTFDAARGLPLEISARGASVASFQYDPAGWTLNAITYREGAAKSTISYRADQVTLSEMKHELAVPIPGWPQHFIYDYDAGGRMTSDGQDHYGYDALDRLTQAFVRNPFDPNPDGGVHQAFEYDGFGNRLMAETQALSQWKAGTRPPSTVTGLGATAILPAALRAGSFRFKASDPALSANRLPESTANGALTGATYDAQGNLTSVNLLPGDARRFVNLRYDSRGQVTHIESQGPSGSLAEAYGLDASGLRTRISDSHGRVRIQIHDEDARLVSSYEGTDKNPATWKRNLVYGGDWLLSEANARSQVNLILSDHLRTPRWIWEPSRTPPACQKFLPFGESLGGSTESNAFAMGFTNHEQTDPSGLIYMQARFYLPMYGRFASPDPGRDQHFEDTQSWNIYSYVKNHPTMSFDPDGMQECAAAMRADYALLAAVEGRGRVGFDQAAAMHRDQVLGAGSPGLQKAAVATTGVAMAASGGYLAAQGGVGTSLMGAARWLGGAGTAAWNGLKDLFSRGGASLTEQSVTDKLSRYLLNTEHPVGGSKAEWFQKALGFTKDNMADLAKQIKFDPNSAVQTGVTDFGTKFNQAINITGANGKTIEMTFAWIKNNDGVVRLVTAIPEKQ